MEKIHWFGLKFRANKTVVSQYSILRVQTVLTIWGLQCPITMFMDGSLVWAFVSFVVIVSLKLHKPAHTGFTVWPSHLQGWPVAAEDCRRSCEGFLVFLDLGRLVIATQLEDSPITTLWCSLSTVEPQRARGHKHTYWETDQGHKQHFMKAVIHIY